MTALCLPAPMTPTAVAAGVGQVAWRLFGGLFGPMPPCRVPAVLERDPEELEEERVLAVQAQAGDREALGTLLRRYGPRLYRSVLLPRPSPPRTSVSPGWMSNDRSCSSIRPG